MKKIMTSIVLLLICSSAVAGLPTREEDLQLAKESLVKAYNDTVFRGRLKSSDLQEFTEIESGENIIWDRYDRLKITTYFMVLRTFPDVCPGFNSGKSQRYFEAQIQINRATHPTVSRFADDIQRGIAAACAVMSGQN